MNVSIITPSGNENRGVGFYTERLIKAFSEIPDTKVKITRCTGNNIPVDTDIIHYPFFHPYFRTLPLTSDKPIVVTVHDLTPVHFSEHFPPGIKGNLNWQIQKQSLKGVKSIITDSQSSKEDIINFAKIDSDKISVIYLAADPIFKKVIDKNKLFEVKNKYNLPDRFVLYVGGANWNKNVPGLARICKKIGENMVITGKETASEDFDHGHVENKPLVELLNEFGADPQIQRIGFVSSDELTSIYSLASLYVQPSFFEGFGLPILEAFSCGCPVASSNKGSLPEIYGDAAISFDPNNIKEMQAKIQLGLKLGSIDRDSYIQKGYLQSKKFSWEKTARETLEIYQKALK